MKPVAIFGHGDEVDDPHLAAHFAPTVSLLKREAFEICEVVADAERALLRSERPEEAARMAWLFDLVESRLIPAHDG